MLFEHTVSAAHNDNSNTTKIDFHSNKNAYVLFSDVVEIGNRFVVRKKRPNLFDDSHAKSSLFSPNQPVPPYPHYKHTIGFI